MIFLKNCDFQIVIFVKIAILKMWFLWKFRVWKCDFCENCDLENMIFVKIAIWKYDFCENCDFENAILVKNVILKVWILLKMRFRKCEFLELCDLEHVNFWIKCGCLPQCAIEDKEQKWPRFSKIVPWLAKTWELRRQGTLDDKAGLSDNFQRICHR